MDLVVDTSALLAVILGEPERERIIALTTGRTLIAPGSISWEIGNAFSAMLKRHRIDLNTARQGMQIFLAIPVRIVNVDMNEALAIAHQTKTYAYDAYFLNIAIRQTAPLLTLDDGLKRAALALGIELLEV